MGQLREFHRGIRQLACLMGMTPTKEPEPPIACAFMVFASLVLLAIAIVATIQMRSG